MMKPTFVLLVATALLLAPRLEASSPHYAILPLGSFGTVFTAPVDMDDQAHVVGTYSDGSGERVFLWRNGQFTNLHDCNLLGDYSTATAMNNNGQIVGSSREGAFIIALPPVGAASIKVYGRACSFYDINDNGQIIGFQPAYSGDPRRGNVARACIWNGGTATPLGTIPLRDESAGVAVNNAGQVVVDGSNGGPRGGGPVFLWSAAGGLGDLNLYALAEAINKDGAIVGQDNSNQALLFRDRESVQLGTLGGSTSHAYDINDAGQIVGTARTTNEADHAVLWENGAPTDLNDAIPANSEWELRSARAINNRGEILGVGVFNDVEQGFVLYPLLKHSADPVTSTDDLSIIGQKHKKPSNNMSHY